MYNVDGTPNKKGTITEFVDLQTRIGDRKTSTRLMVTGLGKQNVILGFPWLQEENPQIDWKKGSVELLEKTPPKRETRKAYMEEVFEEELDIRTLGLEEEEIWVQASVSHSIEFARKFAEDKPQVELKDAVPVEFHEYLKVFSEEAAGRFPESKPWDHKIDLKEGFVPKASKIYPLTAEEDRLVKEFIDENKKKGYIRESESPMASGFFFVPKQDGKSRPCQDYRYINEGTIKNAYPLPLVSDLMDKLKGAKYFTKFDVRWGYNNIRIRKGDEWKAAFNTKYGLYEPLVMFFGLCNSPATFQSMMDHLFIIPLGKGYIIIYMDDILIFAATKEELRERTKEVLKILQDNDLYLKPEKCEFYQTKVKYLGFFIEEGKISMDPAKVRGISEWPVPRTLKQLRSFLGFGNFYRKFIRGYANLARPLNDLLKKNITFAWNPEAQKAFDLLKKRFTEEPVLMMPDMDRPFQIESDASKHASGAVLSQTDHEGKRHPVAFISKSFTPAERNYEIYDRELLAIIRALEEWRHYVAGSAHTTIVLSDHKNLTYYRGPQKLKRMQARWSLILSEYDIKLVHTPGHKMVQSDALSRRPDFCPEEDHDNEDMVLLPENLFVNLIDLELQEKIASAQEIDGQVADALKLLTGNGPSHLKDDLSDWKVEESENGKVVFYQNKNYVPKDLDLRREIVRKYHEPPTAGHPGTLETLNQVQEHFWWPGIGSFVKNYVKGCAICQQFKINHHPTRPALMPIPQPESSRPFANCSMDLITDLPASNGYDSILVVVDHGLTKGVILHPCNKTITAEQVATLLLDNLYKRFGLPDSIISDRGPQFAARSFRELLKLLGITSKLSTAFHPQTDGTTERFNQEIEAYLAIYCSGNPENWSNMLPTLEFTHNNRRHADRTLTSFELMFGTPPLAIPTSFSHTKFPDTKERLEGLARGRTEALAAHELARRRMLGRVQGKGPTFLKGDRVWLDSRNLKLKYESKKIAPKRQGPFLIKEVLGPITYRLELPKQWKIHDVFHASLLSPYVETETYGENFPQPPPDVVNGEEEWEVESILKHKGAGNRRRYFVLWKGYSLAEASWEREEDLEHSQEILADYKARHRIA